MTATRRGLRCSISRPTGWIGSSLLAVAICLALTSCWGYGQYHDFVSVTSSEASGVWRSDPIKGVTPTITLLPNGSFTATGVPKAIICQGGTNFTTSLAPLEASGSWKPGKDNMKSSALLLDWTVALPAPDFPDCTGYIYPERLNGHLALFQWVGDADDGVIITFTR